MKRKGFTLIELLAVIVVLAVIALIATPLVMSMIKNTKKGTAERSAENYIKGVETMIMEERTNGRVIDDGLYLVNNDGNLCKEEDTVSCSNAYPVEMDGEKPAVGSTIAIENGRVVANLSSNSTRKTSINTKDGAYTIEFNNGRLVATEVEPEGGEVIVATPSECFDFEPIYTYNILDYTGCMNLISGALTTEQNQKICSNDAYREMDLLTFANLILGKSKEALVTAGIISEPTPTDNVIITSYKCGNNPTGASNELTGTAMDVVIPEKVTIGGQEKNITAIGGLSFAALNPLNGNSPVDGNVKINSIEIPNTINRMEMAAFFGNDLTKVTIPGSIKFVPGAAFQNINGKLEEVTISSGVEEIGDSTFFGNIINSLDLGNSLVRIDMNAFYKNQLESVIIPSSVTSIGEGAFRYNKLTSVTIPSSVTNIGEKAFTYNNLNSVTIYREENESDCADFGDYPIFSPQNSGITSPTPQCVVTP